MNITVEINTNGQSKVTVNGMAGPDCLKATKELEGKLGVVSKDTKTVEYCQIPQRQGQTVKVGG